MKITLPDRWVSVFVVFVKTKNIIQWGTPEKYETRGEGVNKKKKRTACINNIMYKILAEN